MPESYIQELFADRIGGRNYGKDTAVYKFEKIRRARDAAVKARPDLALIDMGVGEPDGMADPAVVNVLSEQAAMLENRGYSDNGIPEFKDAVAQYMARVYGVRNLIRTPRSIMPSEPRMLWHFCPPVLSTQAMRCCSLSRAIRCWEPIAAGMGAPSTPSAAGGKSLSA